MTATKRESGAAGRKRRKAERERAMQERAQRIAAGGPRPEHLERLAQLGPPPEKTVELLPWVASVAAELLHQVITDPFLDEDRRRKQSADLADKLMKAYPRAALEEQIRELAEAVASFRRPKAIRFLPRSQVQKPSTARGMGRGPRPLPTTPPDDDRGPLGDAS